MRTIARSGTACAAGNRAGSPERFAMPAYRLSVLSAALACMLMRTMASGQDLSRINVHVGSLDGRVVEAHEDAVVIELTGHSGSRVVVQRALVPADALYEIEAARIDQSDPEAWIELSRFAHDQGLHRRRMEALEHAAELDPARVPDIELEQAACREHCSAERLGTARELREAGELQRAMRLLADTALQDAGCVSAEESRGLLQQIQADIVEERARARGVLLDRRLVRDQYAGLNDIADLIERADAALQEGREDLADLVTATRSFLRAEALLKSAEVRLDRTSEGRTAGASPTTDGVPVAVERERLRLAVRDALLEAHIELGHVYLARGDSDSAYEHAGMAAAIDPDDWSVVALRQALGAARGR